MAGTFQDLHVLDLSWGIAGPMTTMFLVDNGADVVRIERPQGDPFIGQSGYRVWNRGKRSVVLDLHSDVGLRHFTDLARTADIVVDSFSAGTMEELGIDHESLSRRSRRAGEPGPEAEIPVRPTEKRNRRDGHSYG